MLHICHMSRLNSVSLNRFCASHFLVWGSIWGFLTTANSMVLKVLTNSVGVSRYAYDKFYYFSHNCVGFTVMRRQNVLNSPTFTLNDIINNMELLLWCLPNIQWKPSLKCVKNTRFWPFNRNIRNIPQSLSTMRPVP